VRAISNPPNPWESVHAEWLGKAPDAKLQVFEENARSIIAENESPDVGFRFSVNPYRGCFHACAYCLSGDTPILMADGRTKPLAGIQVGDEIYGTEKRGCYRYYARTRVLNCWQRVEQAYRVELQDGTRLVASADHRFLTNRGWKHVAPNAGGWPQRPHLTRNNHFLGTGAFAETPDETADYRTGYLCGMIRGDALLASYDYAGRRRAKDTVHQFRLALVDFEALQRARRFLAAFEVGTHEFLFQAAAAGRSPMQAIRTNSESNVARIREIVSWPDDPSVDWHKGFLAGIFDAEGSYSRGILRISNTDTKIIARIAEGLKRFAFDFIVETVARAKLIYYVRIRRGLREHLRFFHTVNPAITRKRNIDGQAIKNDAPLRVVSVEPLGMALPLFDITTGTGDFIANGVVSHNCYARPTHQYLGWGAGTDFETKIVVKVNAPALLRRELSRRSLEGELLIFSGVTDCYQPLEAVYAVTRRCLEVCRDLRQPVGIVTKGALVRRDIDLLSALAREADARVFLSIAFADDETARRLEPNVALPSQRFETLALLASAGIPTGIAIAPIIPGINDSDIPALLARARAAGAGRAFLTLLRLPGEVLPVFEERLAEAFPQREKKIWSAIGQMRGGKKNESRFGARMEGVGPRWKAIEALFEAEKRRLGFREDKEEKEEQVPSRTARFDRPGKQGSLFED
jgi:DNA repair photolyase